MNREVHGNCEGENHPEKKQSPQTDLGMEAGAADEKSRTLLLHPVEWMEARSTAEEGTGHGRPEENGSARMVRFDRLYFLRRGTQSKQIVVGSLALVICDG
jgi:hypothetical protein